MSLINRVAVSNFSNLNGATARDWHSRFRFEVLNFRGQSSAINLTNGGGKTTLAEAILGVLSRDRALISNTRAKCSPVSSKVWTHIQIELIMPYGDASQDDMLTNLGEEVSGEKWVFGVHGHCGQNETLTYYYYQGELEDLPIGKREKNSVILTSNKDFKDYKAVLKNHRINNNVQAADWATAISNHISLDGLKQLVDFQKRGGSDRSANLFTVKPRPGESYSKAFFYEVLAPTLMTNLMGREAEEDEHTLEDTIGRNLSGVIRAKHKVEAKEKEVKQLEHNLEELEAVHGLLNVAKVSQNHFQEAFKGMRLDVAFLNALVGGELPGMPAAVLPEGMLGELAAHVVIEPGKDEIMISDHGLALLTGSKTSVINQLADRKRVIGRKVPQVIEIPCDSFFSSMPERGPKPSFYTAEQSKKILSFTAKFASSLTAEKALELVEDVQAWFFNYADTNPYRQGLIDAIDDHAQAGRDESAAREALERLREKYGQLDGARKELKDNEAVYLEMFRSGVFAQDELEQPAKTKVKVEQEIKAISKREEAFTDKNGRLSAWREDWHEFVREYGEVDPAKIEQNCKTAQDDLLSQKQHIQQQIKDSKDTIKKAGDEWKALQPQINTVQSQVTTMETLLPNLTVFRERFGDESAIGLDQRLIKSKAEKEAELASHDETRGTFLKALDNLKKFKEQLGGDIEPAVWLKDAEHKRDNLISSRNTIQKQVRTLRRQLSVLEQEKVAAGEIVTDALNLLAEADIATQFVHDFIMGRSGLDDVKREFLLSEFSSLLFAPIIKDKSTASKAVKLLQEHELPVPVFVEDAFGRYCDGATIEHSSDEELYIGVHAGMKSRQVECLLDPMLIEQEKERLSVKLGVLESDLANVTDHIKTFSDDNELMQLARKAKETVALDVNGKLLELDKTIEKLRDETTSLEPLITEESIECIKAIQQLEKLGGKAGLDAQSAMLKNLQAQANRYEQEKIDAEDTEVKAVEQLGGFDEKIQLAFPDSLKQQLSAAKKYWLADGPNFDRNIGRARDELSLEKSRVDERAKYNVNFDRAQAYLDITRDLEDGDSIEIQISQLQSDIKTQEGKEDKARKTAANLKSEVIPQLTKRVEQLDTVVCSAIKKYKKVAQLSGGLLDNNQEVLALEHHVAWPAFTQLQEYLNADVEQEILIESLTALNDELESIDIDEQANSVKRMQRDAYESEQSFLERIQTISKTAEGLSPVERERLNEVDALAKTHIFERFLQSFTKLCREQQEKLALLQDKENTAWNSVSRDTSALIRDARSNLHIMKSVAAKPHGNHRSYFVIDADPIDEDGANKLIKELMVSIEVEEKRRKEDLDRNMRVETDEVYKEKVNSMIRDQIYRRIFIKPVVKFSNERIRPKGEYDFDTDLSDGEKAALSLMWAVRLAEFAIEREARNLNSATARKKARNRSENILIIDGLFSNLSDPSLIESVMAGIEDTRGRFQLIGLIHNTQYKNDFNVFPVLLLGRKHVAPGKNGGWVSFMEGKPVHPSESGRVEGEIGIAELVRRPPNQRPDAGQKRA
jgi:hypothetical protein